MEYFIEARYLAKAFELAKTGDQLEDATTVIWDGLKKFDDVSYKITYNGRVTFEVKMKSSVYSWEIFDTKKVDEVIKSAFHGKDYNQDEYKTKSKAYFQFSGECIYYLLMSKPEMYKNFAEDVEVKGGKTKKIRSKVVFLRVVNRKAKVTRLDAPIHRARPDHSFDVCGFWRECKSTGKDANGIYNQHGRTWVIDHRRGDGEYIYKPRVFTGEFY